MLLPYASDRPATRTPLTVVLLVLFHYLVLGLVWLIAVVRGPDAAVLWYADLAFIPAIPHVWSCLTYSMLHADVLHLSVNMLFLWVFGSSVEEALGWRRFLGLYVAAAIVTGWVEVGMARILPGADRTLPIVGASGAISAIIGVFAIRFSRARVRIAGLPFAAPAAPLVAVVMVAEMSAALYHLTRPSAGLGQTPAHWAHLAGFMLGLAYAIATRQSEAGEREYRRVDAGKELQEGRALAAVREWEAIVRERPDDPDAEGELARAWALAGDAEQALLHYRASIAGFIQRGDRSAAAERAARMWEDYPDAQLDPTVWFSCARSLEDAGRYPAAASAYEKLLTAHRDHPDGQVAMVRLAELRLRRLNEPADAAAILEEMLQTAPHSDLRGYAQALLVEARAATGKGDPDGG